MLVFNGMIFEAGVCTLSIASVRHKPDVWTSIESIKWANIPFSMQPRVSIDKTLVLCRKPCKYLRIN